MTFEIISDKDLWQRRCELVKWYLEQEGMSPVDFKMHADFVSNCVHPDFPGYKELRLIMRVPEPISTEDFPKLQPGEHIMISKNFVKTQWPEADDRRFLAMIIYIGKYY